ncbi:Splicing factor U2AF subunit [Nymphaea thermarum]|nr:Splicing factor U2AF subunit [Nymphaea thermarum]
MVGTSRQRDKSGNEFTFDDNEGTAARTRPFSMEDIRLRREKKKLITEQDSVSENPLDNKVVESAYDIPASGTDYSRKKDPVNENVKKSNLVDSMRKARNSDKELVQDCSSKGKRKEVYGTDISSKVISHRDKSRDRVHTDEKRRGHHQVDEGHDAGSKIGIEKNQYKNMKLKDRRGNGGRNSEREDKRESKRRHRTEGVIERNLEPDESDTRKYDSHRRQLDSYLDQKSRNKVSSVVIRDSYRDREEPRSKRRRSASREHHRTRDRSASASPKERKHTSYREREHESSSYYSFKEKRDRLHSEVDKSRKSNSLSGGHHWRYGDSGIGGYSPRKRRSEAAVKTPSPTIRSPEKRTAAWDILPANAENGASVPTLASFLSSQQASSLSELPAASPDISTALNLHPPANANAVSSIDNSAPEDDIQLTQATRPSRRLYVENVPISASDKTLLECFNNFLLSSRTKHVQGRVPCISCMVNKEKNQALLEFLTPEDATAALSFDGKLFSGSILRIKRPKDFIETATGTPDKFGAKIDAVSDLVKDSPNKIFVGGISKALSSDMLREIVSVFGQLKAYHFEWKDSSLSHAFLEYMDQSVTHRACAGLNGMTLGGHVITVVQATPDAQGEDTNSEHPCYSIPDHAKPLLEDPTPVLKLKNVLSEEDFGLLMEPELEEILEDVRLECLRFGTVKSVNVVRYSGNSVIAVDASVTSDNGGSERFFQEPAGDTEAVMPMDGCLKCDDEAIVEKSDNSAGEHQNNHGGAAGGTEDCQDMDPTDPVKREPNHSDANIENDACIESKIDARVNFEHRLDNGDSNMVSAKKESDIDASQSGFTDSFVSEAAKVEGNSDYMKKEPAEERGVHVHDSNELQNEPIEANKHGTQDSSGMQRTSIEMIGLEGSDELQKVPTEAEQAVQEKLEGEQEQTQDNLDNCESNAYDSLIFEPGSIFVEFMRKEGACLAAHSLHGRLYGARAVATGYVSLDLYKARFLR